MSLKQMRENGAVTPVTKGSRVEFKKGDTTYEGEIIELSLCRVRIKPDGGEKPFSVLRGDRRIKVIE